MAAHLYTRALVRVLSSSSEPVLTALMVSCCKRRGGEVVIRMGPSHLYPLHRRSDVGDMGNISIVTAVLTAARGHGALVMCWSVVNISTVLVYLEFLCSTGQID